MMIEEGSTTMATSTKEENIVTSCPYEGVYVPIPHGGKRDHCLVKSIVYGSKRLSFDTEDDKSRTRGVGNGQEQHVGTGVSSTISGQVVLLFEARAQADGENSYRLR